MSRTNNIAGAIVMLLLIFSSAGSFAETIAGVSINPEGIFFTPDIQARGFILSVAAPDGTVRTETSRGAYIPPIRVSGLPDGIYTYEIRGIMSGAKTRTDANVGGEDGSAVAVSQSGHFRVISGKITTPSSEHSAYANSGTRADAIANDIVQADDLIVTGSQCIGFDCLTDGTENFGFDTLKLKENNIRLFFDDTSATVGFPANDWRLIVNDSASGGGNYFSIEDSTGAKTPFKIEAGARTSALYVNSSGRVGLGTSTPVLNLHILSGDTPSVRLDQDTSSGWTAQVWDVAGNESNFFVRDTTGGSKLPFRIQPGTPTNTITLKADGRVGLGTWSPSAPLELERTGINATFALDRTDGSQGMIQAGANFFNVGSTSNHPLLLWANSQWKFKLSPDGSITMANGASLTAGGVWTNASSREFKENIEGLSSDEAIAALKELTPVKFSYKTNTNERHVGFIAEDVPQLLASGDRMGLSPMDIVAVLTKTVQDQQKTIESLDKKIVQLEQALSRLAAMNMLGSAATK